MSNHTAFSWNERFAAAEYVYGTDPNEFLVSQAGRFPRGGRILCIGDGEGRNGVWLAEQGFDVTSLDASEAGQDKTRRLAGERGVKLTTLLADLNDYVFEPGSWDGVVSIFCHLPGDLRRKVHTGVVQGLRSGGVVVVELYHHRQLEFGTGGPPVIDMLATLEQLQSDFAGLSVEHGVETERDVIEGALHTGRAAVVQFVGRK